MKIFIKKIEMWEWSLRERIGNEMKFWEVIDINIKKFIIKK